MSSITLSDVGKRFGDVVAVADLSLTIEDKEFLVLLGPSGCGKSTVLRMIAGLEEPDAGEIRIGDRDVTEVEPKDRDLAMVFQSYALYPHMNVRANIEFPLRSRKVPKPERAGLVQQAAEMLGLVDLLDRKPAQLSGGQRQRVALARAVVREPAAFLMDEPLSNLDAKLRAQTRVELVDLQRRLETTVVYVTHDQVEAMTMGHRVAILDHGVLQQVGAPQDVYDGPANLFVARFIGTPPMNTLTVDVARNDGGSGAQVRLGGAAIPLPEPVAAAVRADGASQVVLGVRPEHVQITEPGLLPATVELVEHLGHERHVMTRLADGQEVVAREGSHGAAPDLGSTVHLGALAEQFHWFDATTGSRLGA
jgi:multiple sugar transport system ATP-binding protein